MTDHNCAQCHRITRDSVETFDQAIGHEPGDGYAQVHLHIACVGAYLIDNPGTRMMWSPIQLTDTPDHPKPFVLRLGSKMKEIPLDPATGKAVEPEPEPKPDWCVCLGLSGQSRLNPGIHHDEGCIMWALPDYGVFEPDE